MTDAKHMHAPSLITDGAQGRHGCLILAHGAGAPMTSPFLETMAGLLAARGLRICRFEFAYMAARREGAKRRPPPRAELLIGEYLAAVDAVRKELPRTGPASRLFIGGKSMGGRVASLIADRLYGDSLISGLVCLGYPFHPPGKPEALRTSHLETLKCPALIVQGERDPFGTRAEVEAYPLSQSIRIAWARDGDHDLGPRGGSGTTRKQNLESAADAVAQLIAGAPHESG